MKALSIIFFAQIPMWWHSKSTSRPSSLHCSIRPLYHSLLLCSAALMLSSHLTVNSLITASLVSSLHRAIFGRWAVVINNKTIGDSMSRAIFHCMLHLSSALNLLAFFDVTLFLFSQSLIFRSVKSLIVVLRLCISFTFLGSPVSRTFRKCFIVPLLPN